MGITDDFLTQFRKLSDSDKIKFLTNLDHLEFKFRINKSYLKYGNHPITIPKEYYDFIEINRIEQGKKFPITFPDGSSASAYIYKGKAGWGEYFQIKVSQISSQTGLGVSQFKENDVVRVEIYNVDGTLSAKMSYSS